MHIYTIDTKIKRNMSGYTNKDREVDGSKMTVIDKQIDDKCIN